MHFQSFLDTDGTGIKSFFIEHEIRLSYVVDAMAPVTPFDNIEQFQSHHVWDEISYAFPNVNGCAVEIANGHVISSYTL